MKRKITLGNQVSGRESRRSSRRDCGRGYHEETESVRSLLAFESVVPLVEAGRKET